VNSDSPLSDREPQTSSICLARPGIVDPIEAIEDFARMFRCYPRTTIYDFQANDSCLFAVDSNMNRPADR